ncbi:MAG TPA: pantetheine-phosphate adenylyltransferase, partial [Candidatus Saccharimonadales bacterium]|nr:pantetheine-phosphate adenylyltransferase [Candidatus Saccharimonadales bacterium]
MGYKFKHSILGGTFDRFHTGHKKLIDTAFANSEKVTIGIATQEMFKQKDTHWVIEDFQTRKHSVEKYLQSKDLQKRAGIIPINDIYGNSLKESGIDAIFATEANLENVQMINSKRIETGLAPLDVINVNYALDQNSEIISSSRIRSGKIDRLGNSYLSLFAKQKKYTLPDELRSELGKPFGKVYKSISQIEKSAEQNNLVIAVGDIASINLFKAGMQADISIFDYKTRREAIDLEKRNNLFQMQKLSDILLTNNQAGAIERRAVGVFGKALKNFKEKGKKQIILVTGEEDLMSLPAILLSPLESIVLYGQPDRGIVMVKVTEKKKK